MKKLLSVILIGILLLFTTVSAEVIVEDGIAMSDEYLVEYGSRYSLPDEVALYLYAFTELPANFITKKDAQKLGWTSYEGNLWEVTEEMSIGGDVFGNREELLPDKRNRTWYECDVNYFGGYRGNERIVFSSDGLIYYTNDHYQTFTLLYDGWFEEGACYGK